MKAPFRIIRFFILITLILVTCGRQSPPPKEDYAPPTIILTLPDNQSLDNSINTSITIVFNEIIDPLSVTSETISVHDAMTGALVEIDIACAGDKVILTARAPLQILTVYVIQVSKYVMDIAGNAMLNPVTFTFTTGNGQDLVPPTVLSTTPAHAATNVSVHAQVVAVFDETMLASSITSSVFLLTEQQTGGSVPGQISVISGTTATFTPANSLKCSTDYLVTLITETVGAGISDTAGNLLVPNSSQGYTWSFTTEPAILTVTKAGTGSGIVSASTGTFSWTGNTGTALYPDYGTPVILTATASEGSTFSGWSGEECTGTGTCTVNMTAARNVMAIFTPSSTYSLAVTSAGTGSGIVSASTGTLTWTGNIGTAVYLDYGTEVILTATASPESTFTGWSGACSGTGSCTVIMTAARSVTATFMHNSYLLTVTSAGTGSGIVSADTGTLTWIGSTGTAVYTDYGTLVTLTATASVGSTFAGWSGEECTGTGTCTVTMSAARSVNATFMITYPLKVTMKGKGTGIVTVNIGTLTWVGKIGTAIYDYNTQVIMTATADSDSIFKGWTNCEIVSGDQCIVTMTAALNINANFDR